MPRRKKDLGPPPSVDAILAGFGASIAQPPVEKPLPPPQLGPVVPPQLMERLRAVHGEQMARQFESLRLFEPLPEQAKFLQSRSKVRIYRGGNRAGKTTVGAVECALAMTGTGGWHGYYPKSDVAFMVVAWDMRDTGLILYRALFQEGHFQIIYDPELKRIRAFRPWAEWDRAYVEKARDAPPLVPPRFVQNTSWTKKGEDQAALVKMVNGSELLFFSGLGLPRKGLKLHGAWVDEELQTPAWIIEIQARLVDHDGLFYWTASPQNGTPELLNLIEFAGQEQEKVAESLAEREKWAGLGMAAHYPLYQPKCEEFHVEQTDNPHLSEKSKSDFATIITAISDDENEADIRIRGETSVTGNLVFPEFHERGPHSIDPFEPPWDWTRYLVVDPGRACASTLFVVPPPHDPVHAGHVYGYDLIYIVQSDASQWGERVQHWFASGPIERMFYDMQYGRQVHSTGRTEVSYYEEELKKRGLACRRTGYRFEPTPTGREEGIEAVRSWLRRLPDGYPKYRIMYQRKRRFEDFVRQMKRFQWVLDSSGRPTNRPRWVRCDTIDNLRYAAMLDLRWVPAVEAVVPAFSQRAPQMATQIRQQLAQQQGQLLGTIHCGPQGVWTPGG
jgi:hypothetical protein